MGEFSLSHWLIILVIVLIFVGPSKLPGLGKGMGEAIRGFKKGLDGGDKADDTAANDPNRQIRDAAPGPVRDSVKTDDKIKS